MKRAQLNLALGAVALGLGVAVFFSQKKDEKGPPLTPIAADAVTKIALEHPGVPAILLEKIGGTWLLTGPVKAPVESVEVNGILALATAETRLTLDATGVKPAELGLEPPTYTVTLNDQKIEVGGVEPLNYRRYIRTGGKIVLIDDPASAALDKDYSDLVAHAPIPPGAQIEKIVLPKLTIARSADGKDWALTPEDPKATSDAKQKLVDGWKNARALWMAAEPEGGEKKGDEVLVTLKDGAELRFIIAEREPQLVLARPDLRVRYTLSKALEEEILKLPDEKKEEPKAEAPTAAP